MQIQPLADQVVIQPLPAEEKTESGILLPETAEQERPEQGTVIAVGPGKQTDQGKVIPVQVKVGDTVLFTKYSPNEVKIGGKEYLVVKQEDILGIITQD